MKSRPEIATFEDLVASRYGTTDERLLRTTKTVEELLANYYGKLPGRKIRSAKASVTLSIHCDDGRKVLAQRNRFADTYGDGARAALPERDHSRIEPLRRTPESPPLRAVDEPAPAPASAALPEPVVRSPDTPNRVEPPRAQEPVAPPRLEPPLAQTAPTVAPRLTEGSDPPAPSGSAIAAAESVAGPGATEDDFLADMQSIFNGQSVYDPVKQKTVRKEELKEYKRESDAQVEAGPPPPTFEPNESQKIFDRISQSMQYAGAYDLGTVELENRFTEFDRSARNHKKCAAKQDRPKSQAAKSAIDIAPGAAEFLQDLDAIKEQAEAIAPANPDETNPGDAVRDAAQRSGGHDDAR